MKIENITEVKKRFTQVVRELPETGMVVVTKDGSPAAVVMEVREDTDLEVLALSSNRRFWRLWDRAGRGKKTALRDIPIEADEAETLEMLKDAGVIGRRNAAGRLAPKRGGTQPRSRTRRSTGRR